MTEQEWLACNDPAKMLTWLRDEDETPPRQGRPPLTERKLRLFVCVCCRWWSAQHPADKHARLIAVAVAERKADGVSERGDDEIGAWWLFCRDGSAAEVARDVCNWGHHNRADLLREFANLLREIIGNPFRHHAPRYPRNFDPT